MAVFGIGLALMLLASVLPRLRGQLLAAYPRTVNSHLGLKPSVAVLQQAVADLQQALTSDADPGHQQMLGILLATIASDHSLPLLEKINAWQQAKSAFREGLAASPVDPYGWYRLALINQQTGMPLADILQALKLSLYAGPVEPELMMERIKLLYAYRRYLDSELQGLAQHQLRLAWELKKSQLLVWLARESDALAWVEPVFVDHLEQWSELQNAVNRLAKTAAARRR